MLSLSGIGRVIFGAQRAKGTSARRPDGVAFTLRYPVVDMASSHTLPAARPALHAHFSRGAEPALAIDSGDTVTIRGIPDVSWGLEPPTSTTAPRKMIEPRESGPCLCGPIAIRNSAPGDALQIDIERVVPGKWGWTYAGKGMSSPAHNAALGLADAPLTLLRWELDAASPSGRRVARSHRGHTVPLRAFPGTIGLAPDEDRASGWVPRTCGGNMDCRELTEGSTLFLPVQCPGGLLSLGDGHAAQGDGELSGTAIECMLEEVRLRITLLKVHRLTSPRIRPARLPETAPDQPRWITLGFADTLDAAAASAASAMLDLMVEELNIPRSDAAALASSQVDLRITQMVNPLKGVHAVWRY
jgi:acetamidase/formamidase